jgi:chromate transporter
VSKSSPLAAFVRASAFHIGAAAAAASLRHDLTEDHRLGPHDIDAAYAVARVTPGTNLLALYAVLGHRLGRWPLAVQAVAVGALVPALVVVVIAFSYTEYNAVVAVFMKGARAGGVAVLLGGAVRLLKPQMIGNAGTATAFAAAAFLAAWFLSVSPFVVLLLAGAAGALLLRSGS